MCTKSFIPTALALNAAPTTVLLLPAMRELVKTDPTSKQKVLAMQEVVVEEPESHKTYKRMVLPLVISGDAQYLIADQASVQITSEPFAELVLEIHPKLCPGNIKGMLADAPIEAFKVLVAAWNLSQTDLSLYAHRVISHFEAERIHQVLAKLPDRFRVAFLSASGLKGMFCRQFLQPASDPQKLDHSVLARYWPADSSSLQTCHELGATLDGFRGVALTFKGLALRIDNSKIGPARASVLQHDPRYTDANRHLVPRETWVAMGFAFSISHAGVIEAVSKAIGSVCIPLRSFKSNGVICWVLAFDKPPPKTSFAVKVDSTHCEVVLAREETNKVRPKHKATKKVKSQAASEPKGRPELKELTITTGSSSVDSRRIDVLEQKFQSLEHRQVSLENKVDSRFDEMAGQLEMILHAVAPNMQVRPREPSKVSESPPPKIPKSA